MSAIQYVISQMVSGIRSAVGQIASDQTSLTTAVSNTDQRIQTLDGRVVTLGNKADSIKNATDLISGIQTETNKIPALKTAIDVTKTDVAGMTSSLALLSDTPDQLQAVIASLADLSEKMDGVSSGSASLLTVPKFTSGSSLNGYNINCSNGAAFRMFDEATSELSTPVNWWCSVEFPQAVEIVQLGTHSYANSYVVNTVRLDYSDNNSSWVNAGTYTLAISNDWVYMPANPIYGKHKYWKLTVLTGTGSPYLRNLQFWGRP